MATGYVSLHREIFDHWLWKEKPFSKGHAWIDLIMMANHSDCKTMFDGRLVDVKRGEFITSETKLSERWGWSRKKVHGFLVGLETESMLGIKKHRKGTYLSLCNYDTWQIQGTSKEPQKNRRRTAEEPLRNTVNNVNNDNNENKKDLKELVAGYTVNLTLRESLMDFIEHRKAIKKPLSTKGVELTFRNLDKLTGDDMEKVDILNQSIANGWQGVFALKDTGAGVKPKNSYERSLIGLHQWQPKGDWNESE